MVSTQPADVQLRQMPLSNLEPGQPLPGNVCAEDGRVIAGHGQELTPELMAIITKAVGDEFFYGGDDWTEAGDAAESDADAASIEDEDDLASQRRHDRKPCTLSLVLRIEEQGGAARTVHVTACDLSSGGFAFEHPGFMHTGTKVRTTLDMIEGAPQVLGVICHCQHLEGRMHRIGVKFLEIQTAPARS